MFLRRTFLVNIIGLVFIIIFPTASVGKQSYSPEDEIRLRAWGVPLFSTMPDQIADLRVLEAFQKQFSVVPVSTEGIKMGGGVTGGGSRAADMAPLMQIAGDIPQDVMYVNFRISDTYIRNKFLYPLDKYIEGMLGLDIANGQNLELDEYLGELQKSDIYETDIGGKPPRVPRQCWKVMRRECPYEEKCQFAKANGGDWDFEPTAGHRHVWAFPQDTGIAVLFYRRDLFSEAGLPNRAPENFDEFFEFAKKLTNPAERRYGVLFQIGEALSWSTTNFLYSMEGKLVDRDETGNWVCTFDSPEAVEAYFFVARLFLEPFEGADGKTINSVVYTGQTHGEQVYYGMFINSLGQTLFTNKMVDPSLGGAKNLGFGPVPKSPTGKRGSEFNALMTGIYAGLEGEENKRKRDAAWEYIRFFNGPEARKIRTKVFVEQGMGKFVQPELLKAAGYEEFLHQIPKSWSGIYETALTSGVPEPYGKNCQNVYYYASKAVNQIQSDSDIKRAIIARKEALDAGNETLAAAEEAKAKEIIAGILKTQVQMSNDKMLNIVDPEVRKKRNKVAAVVAVAVMLLFALLFRRVFRVFDEAQVRDPNSPGGKWQFVRYKWAYILLAIPVGSVILWQYYPLLRGSVMAFQEYNVRGFSEFVGFANFASALYDKEFWYAIWVTLKYSLLFAIFGFTAPILLAFLLTEIPKGKIFFRTLYYLPAVLTGLITIFLWKSFFGEFGMINQMMNFFVHLLNYLPGVEIAEFSKSWLQDPQMALICILMPVIWAGMGPGCLIYLAALKTVPDDIYEAADIDGAGVMHKVFHVAIPSIKALIMINFIGVMVATMKGGGEFALAMTGGGPYTPYGATEFAGLKIFFQAFGYLRFGVATAMAWILGSMLVGFTVIQLQKLSKMEFKTAGGSK